MRYLRLGLLLHIFRGDTIQPIIKVFQDLPSSLLPIAYLPLGYYTDLSVSGAS